MNKTKFIFVTGGVMSSLGKGLAAASILSRLWSPATNRLPDCRARLLLSGYTRRPRASPGIAEENAHAALGNGD